MKKRDIWIIVLGLVVYAGFTLYHLIILITLLFARPLDSDKTTPELIAVVMSAIIITFYIYGLLKMRR